MSPTLLSANSPSRMDAVADNRRILPTTASASVATLRPRPYSAELLSQLEPFRRKCVSEIDLFNTIQSVISFTFSHLRTGEEEIILSVMVNQLYYSLFLAPSYSRPIAPVSTW